MKTHERKATNKLSPCGVCGNNTLDINDDDVLYCHTCDKQKRYNVPVIIRMNVEVPAKDQRQARDKAVKTVMRMYEVDNCETGKVTDVTYKYGRTV